MCVCSCLPCRTCWCIALHHNLIRRLFFAVGVWDAATYTAAVANCRFAPIFSLRTHRQRASAYGRWHSLPLPPADRFSKLDRSRERLSFVTETGEKWHSHRASSSPKACVLCVPFDAGTLFFVAEQMSFLGGKSVLRCVIIAGNTHRSVTSYSLTTSTF